MDWFHYQSEPNRSDQIFHANRAYPDAGKSGVQLCDGGADGPLSRAATDLHLSPGCLWECRGGNQALI